MKKHLSKYVLGAEILASFLILGSIYIWAPVCDGLLTLESGKMVHMKCFYTGQASAALSLILLITAIVAFFSKVDHNKIQWIIITIGIMLIANCFESILGIGICKMSTMACNKTAVWIKASGILAIAGALIDIFANSSKPNKLIL